jgi:hypothetical protein
VCSKTAQKQFLIANRVELFQNHNFRIHFSPPRTAFPKNQSRYEISGLVIIGKLILIELKDAILLQPGKSVLAQVILQGLPGLFGKELQVLVD